MAAGMTLSALLLSVDEASTQLLQKVLDELSIRVECCADFVRAGIRLAQERFDVVIVDGNYKSAMSLLQETRQSRLNGATLMVVVVPGQESIREIFSMGVNFVLYKPLAYDRALSSLRAARAVMRKDKRKKARAPVHAQATIDYANVEQEKAALIDLGENGMSVQFGQRLPPVSKVYFQFRLPDQAANIRLSGQVVWQDWKGRAGVQFVDVPTASRRLLDDFLGANLRNDSTQEQFADVTVEVEELLQPAAVAIAEQNRGSGSTHETVQDATGHEDASPRHADPDNRRTKIRYACHLGAEVYRTGTPVPHRCSLTDLSSGGCYLEVSLPFPKGAAVEIVVRTYEMKLRLRGAVLTSHPGYGMGVAFELKTKEESESVKKLTDFVATTTKPSN
jgi:AmiR/NasT family two-component response regulator